MLPDVQFNYITPHGHEDQLNQGMGKRCNLEYDACYATCFAYSTQSPQHKQLIIDEECCKQGLTNIYSFGLLHDIWFLPTLFVTSKNKTSYITLHSRTGRLIDHLSSSIRPILAHVWTRVFTASTTSRITKVCAELSACALPLFLPRRAP